MQVLELGQVEGKYFMAMEFVPGLSVSQVGKRATKQLGFVPQDLEIDDELDDRSPLRIAV